MKGNKLNSKIIVDNSDDDFSDNDSSFDHNNNENINTNDFETQCDLILKKMTNNYRQQREEIRNLVKLHRKEIKKANK